MRERLGIFYGLLFLTLMTASTAQAMVTSAQCKIQAVDGYGRGASGVEVTLELQFTPTREIPNPPPGLSATGTTDETGNVTLSVSSPHRVYRRAACWTNSAAGHYVLYGGSELFLTTTLDNATLFSTMPLIVVPKRTDMIPLAGGGIADLYQSGGYDKPIVVAQPFNSAETTKPFTWSDVWIQYNGDPRLLAGGMLKRLYDQGYDVWLVRPPHTGDDLSHQSADYAQAVQNASTYQSYNDRVAAAGYSLGGLVVRIAMAKWSSYGFGSPPPVNLIATLDAPLRGALVSNDLQHALWNASDPSSPNSQRAHDHNMDSCSAQQMLENACHKIIGCDYCLECDDNGWYQTFYGGSSFTYCTPSQGYCNPAYPGFPAGAGLKTCSGVGLLNLPNGGWPAGIRKIAASIGKFGERTGVCYGDSRDKTGTGVDGCPTVDAATFDLGTEWGYIDITLSTNRIFKYRRLNSSSDSRREHWCDELTPGSRQPGSVEDVYTNPFGFKLADGHQLLHMGTFIPLYSALDRDPVSGAIPFDEYWTNSYSSFHDALTEELGTWVNQHDGSSGPKSLVAWLIGNLGTAFAPATLTVGRVGSGSGTVTSAPAGIDCGATCSAGFPSGSTVTLTAVAASGSTFAGWSGGACSGAGSCSVSMSGAQSVSATFNLSGGGGCGEASCVPVQGRYVSHFSGPGCSGTESYYLPYDGYAYLCRTWDGGGQCGTIHRTVTNYSARIDGGPCQDLWPTGNTLSDFVTVYRGGVSPTVILSVTRAGTGGGTVTSTPAGIDCGATCSASFNAGITVTLEAAAVPGSTFAGWSGGGCSGTDSCSVSMSGAPSVSATFVLSGGGCGEGSCVPVQGMYVSHFSGPGCSGTESYYLPYDGYGYLCRTWDGSGQCGTIHRTVTNYSAKINGGPCQDLWPSGNTLSDFVTIYR
jgi:hypothetical protein